MDTYTMLVVGAAIRSLLWLGIVVTAFLLVENYIKETNDNKITLRVLQGLLSFLGVILVINFTIQLTAIVE